MAADLPGMWEEADLIGGATDAVSPPSAAQHPDLLAAALKMARADVGMVTRCELTADDGCERCAGKPTAVRYEHGFIDLVCDRHADRAEKRGALVLRPDGVSE